MSVYEFEGAVICAVFAGYQFTARPWRERLVGLFFLVAAIKPGWTA